MKLEQGSLLKCVGEVRGSLRPDEIVVNKNCEMVQRVFKMDHDRSQHANDQCSQAAVLSAQILSGYRWRNISGNSPSTV